LGRACRPGGERADELPLEPGVFEAGQSLPAADGFQQTLRHRAGQPVAGGAPEGVGEWLQKLPDRDRHRHEHNPDKQ
jgi:hypothetical protein